MIRVHPAGCPCTGCKNDMTCAGKWRKCRHFLDWYHKKINEARLLMGFAPLEERMHYYEQRNDEQNEPCD